MKGRIYQEMLGLPPDEEPMSPGISLDEELPEDGFSLELKKKRRVNLLRKLLGDSEMADVLKQARIVDKQGRTSDELMGQ